ncbi:MAG: hypothetical protein AB8E15_13205 [Bdellovibrionales bacterium]
MGELAQNLDQEEAVGAVNELTELQAIDGGGESENNPEDLESYISNEYSGSKASANFRSDILNMVAAKKYRSVLHDISAFKKDKDKNMPYFQTKTDRYFKYIVHLIEAIEEHKSIPNFENLPAAHQKKVHEQVFLYFDELNNTLKRVESVIHDLKVQDVRSTVWVLKSLTLAVVSVACVAALNEAFQFLDNPFETVFKHFEAFLMY